MMMPSLAGVIEPPSGICEASNALPATRTVCVCSSTPMLGRANEPGGVLSGAGLTLIDASGADVLGVSEGAGVGNAVGVGIGVGDGVGSGVGVGVGAAVGV